MELGANLPWITYGGDFGANAWWPNGGLAATGVPSSVAHRISELRGRDAKTLRWFLFCDGRAGIRFSDTGEPLGLDEFVLPDLETALRFASDTGVRIVFTLLDFHWCGPREITAGVSLRGHGATLIDARLRDALLDRVLAPVFDRIGQNPAVAGWDVINEPEWASQHVSRRAMRTFVGDTVTLAHGLSRQPVTVGLASAAGLELVRGLGLDFYQVHWYDGCERRAPLATPVARYGLDRPVVLGEFPTRGSGRTPVEILETAREAGYAASWFWSVTSEDPSSDADAGLAALDESRSLVKSQNEEGHS